MDSCKACKFFLEQAEEHGLCRRYPPSVWIHINGPTVSVFPPMRHDGYCGEFKEKEQ